MIDWDYEFSCPHCGESMMGEVDPDKGTDRQDITCECGCSFVVKARAEVNIDVEILSKVIDA
jgi:transcription elongation factor Elf1